MNFHLDRVFTIVFTSGGVDEVVVKYELYHGKLTNSVASDVETIWNGSLLDSRLKLNQDNTVNITFVEEKMYSKEDIILISEYVRVGSQSTPTIKTKILVDEYLRIKENL